MVRSSLITGEEQERGIRNFDWFSQWQQLFTVKFETDNTEREVVDLTLLLLVTLFVDGFSNSFCESFFSPFESSLCEEEGLLSRKVCLHYLCATLRSYHFQYLFLYLFFS